MRILEVTKTKIDESLPWGGLNTEKNGFVFMSDYDASNEIFQMKIPVQELLEAARKSDSDAEKLKQEFLDFFKFYLDNLV